MTPQEVKALIEQRSKIAGVDPRPIIGIIGVETGGKFNPDAKNPSSSASGLGQFMAANFKSGRYQHNPFDPVQSIDATIKMAKDNAKYSGIPLTFENTGALYGMHQQGAGNFKKAMQNPNASAESVFGKEQARLNGMSGMTAGDGLKMFGKKAFSYAGGASPNGVTMQAKSQPEAVPQIQPPAPPKAELAINTDYTKPFDLNQYNIDSEKSIFGRNLNRAPQTAGTEAVQPIQIQQEAPMNTEPVQQAQSIPQQFQITPFNDVSYGNQQDIALQSIQPQTSDPMYKYIENIWDGTDIAPEEYMNG